MLQFIDVIDQFGAGVTNTDFVVKTLFDNDIDVLIDG